MKKKNLIKQVPLSLRITFIALFLLFIIIYGVGMKFNIIFLCAGGFVGATMLVTAIQSIFYQKGYVAGKKSLNSENNIQV